MSQQQAIGPLMIDIEGLALNPIDREKIRHPNTGGIILFSRNYDNPEQLSRLIEDIRSNRNGDMLIAVDQEGGRVQRFVQGFTRLPAANHYQQQPELAEVAGWLMAMELLAVGVDFSFAPVLDIDCGVSKVIGDRSFGNDAQQVTRLAGHFRAGMRKAGMAGTGKHFPGHGAVALDSHLTLPVDERDLETLRDKDLRPFQLLIREGLEAVMPAHVIYPAVDELPAGFSKKWIQQILRSELNFAGVVFSDDLSMEGAATAGGFPERARLAQEAGCDMLLICNNPKAAEQVLENLPIKSEPARSARLETMRGKSNINRMQLLASSQWQQAFDQINRFYNRYA